MIKYLLALALALLPTCLIARDMLEMDGSGFRVTLTDEACRPDVQKLIRPEWEYPTRGGRVEIPGVRTLALCYSVTPAGVTIIDEEGEGPGVAIPLNEFHVPGAGPQNPGATRTST